ncbi:hypothetical protein AD998_11260 [bacterium 336/3]|nr:hypothetical protein AD998_11260 [bacterium 336/3]
MKKTWIVALIFIQLPLFAQKNYKEALSMAQTKMKEKDYREAAPLLEKAIKFKPKIAQNYYLKGYCLVELSKHTEAIESLDQAIKLDAKQWRYFKKRGDAYYNAKLYDKSLPDYTKAIDLETSKKNDTLFQYRADTYMNLNKYQEAIDDYDKAIAINNKNKQLYFDRGYMYNKLGNKEKGCPDYQKAYEMGLENAKSEAYEMMQCDWAKPKVKEKDNSPVAISDVQVDPFTGAIFISKGLTYEKYEITPKSGGFVTSSIFGYDEDFVLKVDKPRGFNLNNTDAHVGVGFSVYQGNTSLGEAEDLFKEIGPLEQEMLNNLKITLSFPKSEANSDLLLKARFYDKLSNAEILVNMPFTMAEKTAKSNNIRTSTSVLGNGINTKSTFEITVGKIEFLMAGKNVGTLKVNQNYVLSLSEKKNLGNVVNYRYSFVDAQTGERVLSDGKKEVLAMAKGLKTDLPIKTPSKKGNYIVWLEVKESKDLNRIWTMTYPVVVE